MTGKITGLFEHAIIRGDDGNEYLLHYGDYIGNKNELYLEFDSSDNDIRLEFIKVVTKNGLLAKFAKKIQEQAPEV